MTNKRGIFGLALVGVAIFSGCATVNPKPDYERVARHVAKATGRNVLYEPGDEELVAAKVEELLEGGLTADESVQVSLLNNRRLQAAFLNVGMARADLVQSGLFSNPSLGIALKFPSGGGLANLEAGIAQNIAELWQLPVRKRVAKRSLDIAILKLAQQAAELAAQARQTYYAAVAAHKRHGLAAENLSIARNLLELTESRQQAGAGTELDVNLSRAAVVEEELAVESARLEAADARRKLAAVLGLLQKASEIVLLSPLPEVEPVMPDAERLVEVALQVRLDIQAARQAVLAAAARLEQERRSVFSTIELGLQFERGERKSQGGRDIFADTARASIASGVLTAPAIQSRSDRDRDTDFIAGPSLSVELPIFDQNQAQIARTSYAYQQAVKTLEGLEREATREVRSTADRAATAWRLVKLYRDRSLPLAKSNLELSRETYRAGRTSFLSVLESQRFFLDVRTRLVQALERAALAIPELERAVGVPFSEIRKGASKSQTSDGVDP